MRDEWGEGQGEGLPNKDGLLSPTLSSIVPLEAREQAHLNAARISDNVYEFSQSLGVRASNSRG